MSTALKDCNLQEKLFLEFTYFTASFVLKICMYARGEGVGGDVLLKSIL